MAIHLLQYIWKEVYSMSKSKREGALQLSIFIIMIPLIFVVQSNPYYTAIISFVALYSLLTGVYRLTRSHRTSHYVGCDIRVPGQFPSA